MRCWPRRSAIRNRSRLTRNLSRSATCSPLPSAKGGLATRDPRRNARPKLKAFVHLLAVSANLDNAGTLRLKGVDKKRPRYALTIGEVAKYLRSTYTVEALQK
jgi:hypothetical protein